MEEEVMAGKASSEFGRLQSVKASGRKAKRRREENCEQAYSFDLPFPTCDSRIWKAPSPERYDIALYAKLALHIYNLQEATHFKYERWEKYITKYTSELDYYITFGAADPAGKVFPFQGLFTDAQHYSAGTYFIDTWRTFACRPRCNEALDDYWDVDNAIDPFYKSEMPKWLSDEALASDNNTYYVVQDSDMYENGGWLRLFLELAFFCKASRRVEASPPLEINKVVVQTKEEHITEAREKLKAENAIFYISYKYTGVSPMGFAGDHKAIVRKTMDGEPGHMTLEIAYEGRLIQ